MNLSTIGFQLEGDQYAGGDYGASYGDSPYGGSGFTIFQIPIPHNASDDPKTSRRRRVGAVQHRREGMLIGERVFDDKKLWRFEYVGLAPDLVDQFAVFFEARRFRVIPNVADETVYYVGNWSESEFYPVPRIGGIFDLAFTVEEVD